VTRITVTRHQDIDAGHRVVGHEGACVRLHGHTYRIYFTCSAPELDPLGRVIDFGVIKSRLCEWLLKNWDHRFLMWEEDPWRDIILEVDEGPSKTVPGGRIIGFLEADDFGIVLLPYNPTAENLARYLLEIVGSEQLAGTGVHLDAVRVDETRKCSAVARSD
jgi:6-pyruvoyltetrahydropterin/6-carboxytetrahydropterin synthase